MRSRKHSRFFVRVTRNSERDTRIQELSFQCNRSSRVIWSCRFTLPFSQHEMDLPTIFKYGDATLAVITENEEVWILADPFAKTLGYSNCAETIATHVSPKNQRMWKDFVSYNPSLIVKNVHARSTFINQAGVFELVMKSCTLYAREFGYWVNNVLFSRLQINPIDDFENWRNVPGNHAVLQEQLKSS